MQPPRTCDDCGASLDPGERCDCWKKKEPASERQLSKADSTKNSIKIISLKTGGVKS